MQVWKDQLIYSPGLERSTDLQSRFGENNLFTVKVWREQQIYSEGFGDNNRFTGQVWKEQQIYSAGLEITTDLQCRFGKKK